MDDSTQDKIEEILVADQTEPTLTPGVKTTRKTRAPKTEIPKSKKEKISSKQLTGILYLAHTGIAQASSTPDFEISEQEAEAIASSIVELLQHYDFETSAKTLAWANLIGVLGTVYGLKIFKILSDKKDKNENPEFFLV